MKNVNCKNFTSESIKASLVAQLVKNRLQCRRLWFNSWVRKIPWRRDRLSTSVFLGFPCGSAGKESSRNAGVLGSIPGLGRSPGDEKRLPTPVFWPGKIHGVYSPWGHKEFDMTEWLSPQKVLKMRQPYNQPKQLVQKYFRNVYTSPKCQPRCISRENTW